MYMCQIMADANLGNLIKAFLVHFLTTIFYAAKSFLAIKCKLSRQSVTERTDHKALRKFSNDNYC